MSRVLCEAFRKRSRSVWRLIRRGQSAGIRAAEETLTNLVLLELSLIRDPGLFARSFSSKEERIYGADWEMWLGGSTGSWLGLRLQAKAVDLKSSAFRHLHYRAPGAPLSYIPQIANLFSREFLGYARKARTGTPSSVRTCFCRSVSSGWKTWMGRPLRSRTCCSA